MIKNLPNFISIYRLVTIPFVAWFLLEELHNYAALFTLLIAVSDFLDGFIARYFKVQSELGSYLDAIADKAFVISIFILIGNLKLLPVFIIIIIISRDIIILGSFAVTFLVGKKIEVKPTKISKLNTFFQFCLVITTMLSNINGYEKYFTALMLNEVSNKKLELSKLVDLLCRRPAEIYKMKSRGLIQEGYKASLTVVDLNLTQSLEPKDIMSRCGWSPFTGKKLTGWPVVTVINGDVAMYKNKLVKRPNVYPVEFDEY